MKLFAGKQKLWLEIRYYIAIIIGAVIAGISYTLFIIPNGVAPSGVSGIANIITRYTGFNMGLLIILINVPLYIISWRKIGLDFGIKSLLGTFAMSLAIDYIPVQPLNLNDPLLGAVFGGIMLGAGLGIAFRNTGSTGGTDILAKLFSQYFPSRSTGNYVMGMDIIVIIINGVTATSTGEIDAIASAKIVLYSLICMYISGAVIDFFEDGVKSAKAYYIITDKSAEIAGRINKEMERGVSRIKIIGTYTNNEHDMLVCLCLRQEVGRLRSIIKAEDAHAFVYVVDAKEVSGLGFEAEDRKKLL